MRADPPRGVCSWTLECGCRRRGGYSQPSGRGNDTHKEKSCMIAHRGFLRVDAAWCLVAARCWGTIVHADLLPSSPWAQRLRGVGVCQSCPISPRRIMCCALHRRRPPRGQTSTGATAGAPLIGRTSSAPWRCSPLRKARARNRNGSAFCWWGSSGGRGTHGGTPRRQTTPWAGAPGP